MSVHYHMISDFAREGYELGKGPWAMDEFSDALQSDDPVGALVRLFAEEEPGFSSDYAAKIAGEIAAFAKAHPDWRVVDDCGDWDGDVVDDEWRAVLIDEGCDPADLDFPIYRRVGSRYENPGSFTSRRGRASFLTCTACTLTTSAGSPGEVDLCTDCGERDAWYGYRKIVRQWGIQC